MSDTRLEYGNKTLMSIYGWILGLFVGLVITYVFAYDGMSDFESNLIMYLWIGIILIYPLGYIYQKKTLARRVIFWVDDELFHYEINGEKKGSIPLNNLGWLGLQTTPGAFGESYKARRVHLFDKENNAFLKFRVLCDNGRAQGFGVFFAKTLEMQGHKVKRKNSPVADMWMGYNDVYTIDKD